MMDGTTAFLASILAFTPLPAGLLLPSRDRCGHRAVVCSGRSPPLPKKPHNLRVVACIAHAFEKKRQRMLDAGYDEVVTKPVTRERLLAAILV